MSEETAKAAKRKGLGRGLNALFEDEESFAHAAPQGSAAADKSGTRRMMLGIDQMAPNPTQPRQFFSEEALAELAESIKTHGLLQPILVRPPAGLKTGPYQIVAGERRWRASQRAGLHNVPVVVMELDDEQVLEIALIENLQREDLNPVEEAKGYRRLMDEYGHTQEELADSIGKSRSHIANMVRLLNLPEKVQGFLQKGELSAGHARALITSKDPEELAKEIILKGLSVRETENLAGTEKPKKAKGPYGDNRDTDTRALERDLSNQIGMRVSLTMRGMQNGTLRIDFKTLDQLDDLIYLLRDRQGGKLAD